MTNAMAQGAYMTATIKRLEAEVEFLKHRNRDLEVLAENLVVRFDESIPQVKHDVLIEAKEALSFMLPQFDDEVVYASDLESRAEDFLEAAHQNLLTQTQE